MALCPIIRLTAMACGIVALFGACSGTVQDSEPPAALNPAPPIRKAFIDRMLSFNTAFVGIRTESGKVPEGTTIQAVREAGITNFPAEDPWGGEIHYSGSGLDYEISSAGPDKVWKTKDDILIRNGQVVP
jgi:hypothetical protein